MRILIADDHALFRRGLKHMIEESFPAATVMEADNAQQAIEAVRSAKLDLVLLDISMPGRSGVDALVDIRQTQPELPIIVLSAHREDQYAIRVLKAGAAGYVEKGKATHEIVAAVQKALEGGKYISPTLAEKLATSLSGNGNQHGQLSPREFEVLRLIGSGKSVKEISAILSISIPTVSTHRARILQKLGLATTSQLIRYAVDHGLFDTP